jgi:hypothetical protein
MANIGYVVTGIILILSSFFCLYLGKAIGLGTGTAVLRIITFSNAPIEFCIVVGLNFHIGYRLIKYSISGKKSSKKKR